MNKRESIKKADAYFGAFYQKFGGDWAFRAASLDPKEKYSKEHVYHSYHSAQKVRTGMRNALAATIRARGLL